MGALVAYLKLRGICRNNHEHGVWTLDSIISFLFFSNGKNPLGLVCPIQKLAGK